MSRSTHPMLFPWEILRATIGGSSAIDIPRLQVYNLFEAEAFLDGYGFHWDDLRHRVELENYRTEAIEFIQQELLADTPNLEIPSEIYEQKDIRQLLLWASDQSISSERQRWSCSLLRVMHTLAHSGSYFNERFSQTIHDQILQRFTPHLQQTSQGLALADLRDSIPLVHFEIKHTKPKSSLLIKLLHKPENVAADVFDRLGVRFVAYDRFDALRIVRYLRTRNVFMFANIKPSRSRNTLIDIDWLRQEVESLLQNEEATEEEQLGLLRQRIEEQPYTGPPDSSRNPYSDRKYHAIQFTCRQLIRISHSQPPYLLSRMESVLLAQPALRPLRDAILKLLAPPPEIRFFFPFEVQVLDAKSYEASRHGDAAHNEYKQRQLEAVKQRVLGALLKNNPSYHPRD